MLEIRIHGRGGQGAVTTGQLMAIAAFYDGFQSQAFPHFGVERAGAPVVAYVRINKKPITIRHYVYEPNVVLVLDSSLLQTEKVSLGVKKGGHVIVNTEKSPEELKLKGHFTVHTIDATSTAYEIFHHPIVNTAVLGAFSKVTKMVSLRSLMKAIDEIFIERKGKKIADLNKKAIKKVYNETK